MTTDEELFNEFTHSATSGDLLVLSELVKRADEIKAGLKKLDDRTKHGKDLLKDLIEVQIPETFAKMGASDGDSFTFGGVKVEVKADVYCNVPSQSAINDERDDERRQELIERRAAGLAILEEKAPALIKRKYDLEFEKDDFEAANRFEEVLKTLDNAPEMSKSLSVHPQTLSKWVKELRASGYAFTPEEEKAFGIYPKKVAKITK